MLQLSQIIAEIDRSDYVIEQLSFIFVFISFENMFKEILIERFFWRIIVSRVIEAN